MRLATVGSLASYVADYRDAPLTYAEVGATAGPLPEGYGHLRRRSRLGTGEADFARAAEALLGWEMHRRAGLAVVADGPAAPGDTLLLGLGLVAVLVIPCRVVAVVDETSRRGFAYGTLRDHPEQGEERFVVSLADDGMVWFDIAAFSRPGSPVVRWSGPAGRAAQRLATSRYQHALTQLVAESRRHV